MLIAEYDYDMDIEVQREEAFEEGVTIGEARGKAEGKAETIGIIRNKLQQGMALEKIAHWMELDIKYVQKVANIHEGNPNQSNVEIATHLIKMREEKLL